MRLGPAELGGVISRLEQFLDVLIRAERLKLGEVPCPRCREFRPVRAFVRDADGTLICCWRCSRALLGPGVFPTADAVLEAITKEASDA